LTAKFNDSSILITIISWYYLNLWLANECIGEVTIPTSVINSNQWRNILNFLTSCTCITWFRTFYALSVIWQMQVILYKLFKNWTSFLKYISSAIAGFSIYLNKNIYHIVIFILTLLSFIWRLIKVYCLQYRLPHTYGISCFCSPWQQEQHLMHYEYFILHIFASILCVICKNNFVANGRSHYYPGSGCPRCTGVDFEIKDIYISM
jgi:hypothetical protein